MKNVWGMNTKGNKVEWFDQTFTQSSINEILPKVSFPFCLIKTMIHSG